MQHVALVIFMASFLSSIQSACLPGSYPSSPTACTSCPAGFYCDGSSKNPCPTGTYQAFTSRSACASCEGGKYSDQTASTYCYLCPINTYNPNTGSSSIAACTPCSSGQRSDAGSISCTCNSTTSDLWMKNGVCMPRTQCLWRTQFISNYPVPIDQVCDQQKHAKSRNQKMTHVCVFVCEQG